MNTQGLLYSLLLVTILSLKLILLKIFLMDLLILSSYPKLLKLASNSLNKFSLQKLLKSMFQINMAQFWKKDYLPIIPQMLDFCSRWLKEKKDKPKEVVEEEKEVRREEKKKVQLKL